MDDRIRKTLGILKRRYPDAGFGTDMGSPFHTLVATMLSAQTTDKMVLAIYPDFRRRFPTASELAAAPQREIEKYIKRLGLYRTKARNLKLLGALLADREVPRTMEGLTALPGVGRKTASIVLACCFGEQAIAVDTHVHRVVHRLGWVRTKTPQQTEKQLRKIVPQELWNTVNLTMVPFGRDVCIARKPECWRCPLVALCDYPKKNLSP